MHFFTILLNLLAKNRQNSVMVRDNFKLLWASRVQGQKFKSIFRRVFFNSALSEMFSSKKKYYTPTINTSAFSTYQCQLVNIAAAQKLLIKMKI
jgi:hypothetical protein